MTETDTKKGIVEYVKKNISKGYDSETLKWALISQGYSRSIIEKSIEQGNSFESSFKLYKDTNKLIPIPIQQIIITSERSGKLPEVLMNLGQTFEEKLQTTTKNLIVILEPVLLIIIWLGVLFVALSVILPIYSLIGGLNK